MNRNYIIIIIIILILILVKRNTVKNSINNIIENLNDTSRNTNFLKLSKGTLPFIEGKGVRETYVGNLKVATDYDMKKAAKFAIEQTCKKKGYIWVQGGQEFVYDCKHSQQTC